MNDDPEQGRNAARKRDGNGFILFLIIIAGIAGLVGWGALRRASGPPEPLALPEILIGDELDNEIASDDDPDGVEPAPIATAGADVGVATEGELLKEASEIDFSESKSSNNGTGLPTPDLSVAEIGMAETADQEENYDELGLIKPSGQDEPPMERPSHPDDDVSVANGQIDAETPRLDIPHDAADAITLPNDEVLPEDQNHASTLNTVEDPNNLPSPTTEATEVEGGAGLSAENSDAQEIEKADLEQTRPPETATSNPDSPTFDLVRIDPSGGGLVAGRAAPGTKVRVLVDGQEIGIAEASQSGEFVAFVQTPASNEGQLLSLAALDSTGSVTNSQEQILVLPGSSQANGEVDAPPAILKAEPEGVRVIPPAGLAKVPSVTLDVITYDKDGQVLLSGRAPRKQTIRLYVDQRPIIDVESLADGTWESTLPGVDEGRYVLRVDALNDDGTVSSRVESPFQRVYPTAEQQKLGQITVQPGHTLWVLAEERYGSGFQYTQIFAANRGLIRNPDLIYPGQIFELPEEGQSGQ